MRYLYEIFVDTSGRRMPGDLATLLASDFSTVSDSFGQREIEPYKIDKASLVVNYFGHILGVSSIDTKVAFARDYRENGFHAIMLGLFGVVPTVLIDNFSGDSSSILRSVGRISDLLTDKGIGHYAAKVVGRQKDEPGRLLVVGYNPQSAERIFRNGYLA